VSMGPVNAPVRRQSSICSCPPMMKMRFIGEHVVAALSTSAAPGPVNQRRAQAKQHLRARDGAKIRQELNGGDHFASEKKFYGHEARHDYLYHDNISLTYIKYHA
jgi:hypothetical protein